MTENVVQLTFGVTYATYFVLLCNYNSPCAQSKEKAGHSHSDRDLCRASHYCKPKQFM